MVHGIFFVKLMQILLVQHLFLGDPDCYKLDFLGLIVFILLSIIVSTKMYSELSNSGLTYIVFVDFFSRCCSF